MPDVYAFVDRDNLTKPTIHNWNGRPMAHPGIVIIATEPDGIFLYRYAAEGEFAGETWRESFEEAAEQARFEYGDPLGRWHAVPDDARDFPSFAIEKLRNEGR